VVWSYFDLSNQAKFSESQDLLHDAGTWWSIGTRIAIPMAQQKMAFAATRGILSVHFTLIDAVEDGDKVVLELESRGEIPGGGIYENAYLFKVKVWEGSLLHVREYADTKAADKLPPALLAQFGVEPG
jgi:ketosteroid isomerase-like protein